MATVVSTNQQALHKEMEHIRKALQACSFPPCAVNCLHNKFSYKHNIHNGQTSTDIQPNNNNGTKNNISMLVPCIHGLGERFKRTCKIKGIQVYFKGTNTFKTLFIIPKDRDSKLQQSGVIYKFKCPHINCPEEYIGESGRTFEDRLKEHLRAPSPIHHHNNSTEHPVNP